MAVGKQVPIPLPEAGVTHAHRADGVAVVAALDGDELVALRVRHGGLERYLDRLRPAGRAVAFDEFPRRHLRQEFRKLRPRFVEVTGAHVVGPVELPYRIADLRDAPADVPDAPAREKINIPSPALIEEVRPARFRDLKRPRTRIAPQKFPVFFE